MAIPAKRRWMIYCVGFALTLMAVRWAGGQDPADSRVAGASKASQAARPAPVSASTTKHVPELRLDRLGMRAPAAPTEDPFLARSWTPAPDPEAVQRRLPPPRPQAPPLPFTYMGKMVDGNTTVVFLANGDRNYIARLGETLDGTYQVERIADNELVVTYLPLKSRQTLPFGGDTGSASAPAPRPQGRGARRDDEDDEDDDSAAKPVATSVPQFTGALSAAAAAAVGDLVLALNAPSQAIVGQEFTVSLALPGRNEGASATIELVYDPAVLNAVGGRPTAPPPAPGAAPPPDPGRAPASVVAPAVAGAPGASTAVRFRVVANAPTTTTIRVNTLSSTDAAGRPLAIASPGTITVTIVDAQGAR